VAQRALVTGASRGIGRAIAIALAQAGLDVAPAARTLRPGEATANHSPTVHQPDHRPLPGSVEETAAEIRRLGRRAVPLRLDLTDLGSAERATRRLLEEWGGVDVVVHNGRHIGPGQLDSLLDTPADQLPLFLAAHGVTPLRITQLVLPGMLERGGGTIAVITSRSGTDFYPRAPRPGLAYRMAKAAGHTLVGSLLAEYGAQGIRAFNVDPGLVLTERMSLYSDPEKSNFDPATAAPPSVVGAAVAWLVTSPQAAARQGSDVNAQELALEHNLHPEWRHEPSTPAR
jgi:NAD(P)-dependent dehydrogenase (short-subunit alcohol dehydrogenase family)